MSELDGIGEVVSGAAMARAVEPKAGEPGPDGHTHETACLNCGAPLAGNFCSTCGQHAHVHRTLGAFWHDLLHGVLHFEGKTWRTIPMLAWRPGELTRRYIDGERAKFVSPIAMFLFTVFIMFAVASFTGGFGGDLPTNIRTEFRTEVVTATKKLADMRAERDAAAAAGKPTADIDRRIATGAKDLKELQELVSGQIISADDAAQIDAPAWIAKPVLKVRDNPELALYKFKTGAYKYSWALIPLSVPFLWLLFPFSRRFRLYDHTIFVTYSLAFMSLLMILAMLMGSVGLGSIVGLLFFIPPFHMYRQLKGAYGLGRGSALARTVLLVTFATIALSMFMMAILGVGAFA